MNGIFKISAIFFAVFVAFSFSLILAAPSYSSVPEIISFSPTGATSDNPQFNAIFSEQMVDDSQIGKTIGTEKFPFKVEPAIIAEGRWVTKSEFTADLIAPLPKATAFTATVRGKTFTFQTEALKFVSAVQSSYALAGGAAEVYLWLNFNLPVSPERLSSFLSLTTYSEDKLPVSFISSPSPSRSVVVSTKLSGAALNSKNIYVNIAKGLNPSVGHLGITTNVRQAVPVKAVFEITDSRVNREHNVIRFITTNAVDISKAAKFIFVQPTGDYRIEPTGEGFQLAGDFQSGQRIVVSLKKGLPSRDGKSQLYDDYEKSFIFPDYKPSVTLPNSGMYLSPTVGSGIPVEIINVTELEISFWKLYESNIPFALRNSSFRHNLPLDLSRRIAKKTAFVGAAPNEKTRRAIDLKNLVGGDLPLGGLYLLTINAKGGNVRSNDDEDDDEYEYDEDGEYYNRDAWRTREQIIAFSDIGLSVRMWPGGCFVLANSLSEAKPVENALIKIYSTSLQVMAEGRTDAKGIFSYFPGGFNMHPFVVTASKGDDVTFLKLETPLINQEIFDTSGSPRISGYHALLFAPRGIYRPGETVNIKAIVREAGNKTPNPFPVLFIMRDPLGKIFMRGTAQLSDQGGADIECQLTDISPTGDYTVELYVPGGNSGAFASMKFSVEDFVPPRIEVSLKLQGEQGEQKFILEDESALIDLSSKYLFGVPAANMDWVMRYRTSAVDFVPAGDKFKGFKFSDPEKEKNFQPAASVINSGKLDAEGKASVEFEFAKQLSEEALNPPSILSVAVTAVVQEDSGRWVSKELYFKYFPNPFVIGLAIPNKFSVNRPFEARTAVLTPESELAEEFEANAVLYRVVYHYNLVQRDGVSRWQLSEELQKIDEKPVLIEEGMAKFEFTPKSWGEYLVRVEGTEDNNTNISASARFWCDDESSPRGGSRLMDKVEIETDKTIYKVGDVAKITVRAPFSGTLLFTVENAKLIEQQVVEMTGFETNIFLPISGDVKGDTLWCVASVLRPVKADEPWAAHRAIGVKPIMIDASDFKLPLSIEAPDKIMPFSKLPVKIKAPAGSEVALALVDEGVLQITGYNTPSPHPHFYPKRALISNLYDIYDWLMQVESNSTPLLHPSGGMAAKSAAFMGNMKSKRFRILSIFKPAIKINQNGEADVELDVPEFSGKARLFAVAASGASFGNAEKFVQIARDIVVEANLPRFSALGDTFTSPVTVFNTNDKEREVVLNISASAPLSVTSGGGENVLKVPAKSSKTLDIAFKADGVGTAKYSVTAKSSQNDSFTQEIELPIRGIYPVVTKTRMGKFGTGNTEINLPLMGSGAYSSISIMATPVADLLPAVNYLLGYPYGCIEQTVSRAWALLAVPEAVSMNDPLLVPQEEILKKLSTAISHIQTMQLYNGSFSMWSGGNRPWVWASVYAAHFLSDLKKSNIMINFPDDMLRGALNYLRNLLAEPAGKNSFEEDITAKAYACFVLASENEAPLGIMYWLKENAYNLLPSGKIWLAGAYALAEGKPDAMRALGSGFDAGAAIQNPYTLESAVRNASQALYIWSLVEPASLEAAALADKLITWGKIGRWYGTQENSAAAVALASYNKATGAGKVENNLKCTLTPAELPADGKEFKKEFDIRKGLTTTLPQSQKWILKAEGSGSGYYSFAVTGEPLEAPAYETRGLKVESIMMDSKGNEITNEANVGSEIFISLDIIPELSVSDVVVLILLPAGLEIEATPKESEFRVEARDDRLLLFFDRLNESVEYKFTVRAVTPGSFSLPPIYAEGMYDPAVRFVGESGKKLLLK